MPTETLLATLALAALPAALYKAWRRLQLSRAKHPSLAGHSLWAKRIARLRSEGHQITTQVLDLHVPMADALGRLDFPE